MEIRPMGPDDDRLAVSHVYEQSWKHAYRGIIPDAYLDGIPEGRWAEGLNQPGREAFVVLEEGRIVGTSSYCASRLPEMEGWGEVISIYLLPEAMGKGYGRALLRAVVQALEEMGFRKIFLWVLEENRRARMFYEKAGFTRSGRELEVCIGGRNMREVQYILRMD